MMCGSEISPANDKMVAARITGIVSYVTNTSGTKVANAFSVLNFCKPVLKFTLLLYTSRVG